MRIHNLPPDAADARKNIVDYFISYLLLVLLCWSFLIWINLLGKIINQIRSNKKHFYLE